MDGQFLASGSQDRTIGMWRISSGELIRSLKGHFGSVTKVVFSDDGKYLASGSYDSTIGLWKFFD